MKNKKSQIQIFETMAVLIVFFILIGIGFIFYTKVIQSNISSEQVDISQTKSVTIAQRVMFLPELQCTEDNVPKEDCIDTLKLASAKNVMANSQNSLFYYDLFEFSDISIKEVYPSSGAAISLYSKTTADFSNSFVTSVPATLYDPIAKTSKFGIITIKTQAK